MLQLCKLWNEIWITRSNAWQSIFSFKVYSLWNMLPTAKVCILIYVLHLLMSLINYWSEDVDFYDRFLIFHHHYHKFMMLTNCWYVFCHKKNVSVDGHFKGLLNIKLSRIMGNGEKIFNLSIRVAQPLQLVLMLKNHDHFWARRSKMFKKIFTLRLWKVFDLSMAYIRETIGMETIVYHTISVESLICKVISWLKC